MHRMSDDTKRIRFFGGPAKLAEMLGYDHHGHQRVHNWITRGIPSAVKVERPDLFMRPLKELESERKAATASTKSRAAERAENCPHG